MRKKSASGVLITREAYLADSERVTNDASRTTDEENDIIAHPDGHSDTDMAGELAALW